MNAKIKVDTFETTTFDNQKLTLDIADGDKFAYITIRGYIWKAARVYKIEKSIAFRIYHKCFVHTLDEISKMLERHQVK